VIIELLTGDFKLKEFEFELTNREGFQQKFIFAPRTQNDNGPLYLFT